MKILPGNVVLVTGASSGIGREIALAFARKGCRLALLARRQRVLEEVAAQVETAGGEALVLPADVRDAAAVESAVQETIGRLGGLQVVVPNAGLGRYALAAEQDPSEIEQLIRINYLGTVHTVRAALPHLLGNPPAHIVAVASSAGLIPHRLGSAYCATKAAVIQYLAAVRLEVLDRGIGVSWICPGAVKTPFFEGAHLDPDADLPLLARLLVRTLDAGEVARATVRAVERNRREVAMPGFLRSFAWIRRLTPTIADWINRKLP